MSYNVVKSVYKWKEWYKMQVWFVISLIFSLIIAVFAALNSNVVTISLLFTKYELSQSLVIILSAVIGAIIAIFLGLFNKIKTSLKIRELNNEIKNSKAKIAELSDIINKNSTTTNSDNKANENKSAEFKM